jgi:exopolysaccharide biosynthesis polyprenyl glycosylphosphotransferase
MALFSRSQLCESKFVVNFNVFGLLQRLADFLSVFFAFALGYWIYHLSGERSVNYSLVEFLGLGAVAGVIFLMAFNSLKLFENKTSLLNVVETRLLLIGWALGSLLLFSVTFYVRFLDLSRLMVSYSLGIALVLLIIEQAILYHLHVLARVSGKNSRLVLIFGAGAVGRHLYKRIYHSPALGLKVAGFLDDEPKLWGREVHIGEVRRKNGNVILGGLDLLKKLKEEMGVKEVFLAMPNASYQRNMEIAEECRKLGLSFSVVPPTYGHYLHHLEVEDIGGIPILRPKERRPHLLYPFCKRVFDIAASAFALTLLSPLFLLLSIVVKLDSPGPVIFRQKRMGLNGKPFNFLKFRTMHANSDPYAETPRSSEDARITKFGRWLRRSSLDELPQFWNVLRGDMSIVGPRPEMPFIVSTYNEEQRERLKVKPGITGVWQISAVRGEPIHANMEYDLFYIEHRSLLLDLIIMIKTLMTAARGIGAI